MPWMVHDGEPVRLGLFVHGRASIRSMIRSASGVTCTGPGLLSDVTKPAVIAGREFGAFFGAVIV
jgi:hypothetical protein